MKRKVKAWVFRRENSNEYHFSPFHPITGLCGKYMKSFEPIEVKFTYEITLPTKERKRKASKS